MSIGATTGKEPDYVADGDLRTLDQLRGEMKHIKDAKLSMGEMATVKGVQTEIEVLKQSLEMTHEQLRRLIGMYQTIAAEFQQFREMRVTELNLKVNGGSTTPSDQEFVARASNGSTTPEDYDDNNN